MTDKQSQDNLQMINFRMTPDEIARLDQVAQELGFTRSQILRNWITVDLEEYAAFKKVGIVRAALTVRDVLNWMADKARTVSEDIDNDQRSNA